MGGKYILQLQATGSRHAVGVCGAWEFCIWSGLFLLLGVRRGVGEGEDRAVCTWNRNTTVYVMYGWCMGGACACSSGKGYRERK